jgi:hypothetical protein
LVSSLFFDLESWDKGLLGVSLVVALALDLFLEESLVSWLSTFQFFLIFEAEFLGALAIGKTTNDTDTRKDTDDEAGL